MKRSELLPEIFFDETLAMSEMELFQNRFLRSIIKYQHTYLIAICTNYCQQMNAQFASLNEKERKRILRTTIQKNQSLRNTCIGLIIGFLEEAPFAWYLENKSACNKRILQMIEKRVLND